MRKNNLEARVAAWVAAGGESQKSKTKMHKPGSQKK